MRLLRITAACGFAVVLTCSAGCEDTQTPPPPVQEAAKAASGNTEGHADSAPLGWRTLEPGLELGLFDAPVKSSIGDSLVRVVRVDPEGFDMRLFNASGPGQGHARTAREWALREELAGAINASMYQTDLRRSVSLMRSRGHVNNPRVTADKAVLALDPLEAGLPRVRLIDPRRFFLVPISILQNCCKIHHFEGIPN